MISKKKKTTKKLDTTKEVEVNEAKISGNHNDGSGEVEDKERLKKTLSLFSIENAFSQPSHPNALDYIVNPGDIIRGLLMRGDIPSKPSEGMRRAIAIAHHLAKAREFKDEGAVQEALDMLAITTSVDGKRIELLVKAIIGDNQAAKEQKGFGNYIKKLAFGDGQKKEQSNGI